MLQWTELWALELETCILAWILWGSWHEHVGSYFSHQCDQRPDGSKVKKEMFVLLYSLRWDGYSSS